MLIALTTLYLFNSLLFAIRLVKELPAELRLIIFDCVPISLTLFLAIWKPGLMNFPQLHFKPCILY